MNPDAHSVAASFARRLATVLQDSNDAITVQDLQGNILAWNRGAERMYGYSEADAVRMNIEMLIPEEERESARGFLEAIRRGDEVPSLEVKRKAKDGRLLEVWLTTTKLVDDQGHPVAVATTERDVTERNARARELAHAHARLESVLQNVASGVIFTDGPEQNLIVNAAASRILGLVEQVSQEQLQLRLCTPDGRRLPRDEWPLRRALQGERIASAELLVVRSSGERCPIRASAEPIRRVAGTIEGAVLTIEDISIFKEVDRLRDEFVYTFTVPTLAEHDVPAA